MKFFLPGTFSGEDVCSMWTAMMLGLVFELTRLIASMLRLNVFRETPRMLHGLQNEALIKYLTKSTELIRVERRLGR